MRRQFVIASLCIIAVELIMAALWPPFLWTLLLFAPLILIGYYDYFQTQHAIVRNFPIVGHFRYMFEAIRPEIYQYFIESDTDGRPFGRDQRSVVYQRAKDVRDTVPFGTLEDVYEVGYEWVNHSIVPTHLEEHDLRVMVGGPACTQPYSASIFNVSAMSYGSLSKTAVLALSQGAKLGNFAHNTGEGGVSEYHLAGGGDLIWQIGTGYFGCRTADGRFNPETYAAMANKPNIKMVELKISQGAKPGHGGILPAAKLTAEIAAIRHVPMGQDVLSPPAHSAFSTPVGLLEFIAELRRLANGKPVGMKLCIGKRREFFAICKAMQETGIKPDFITVDGGEGGTGAAPLEFTNHVGTPLVEGLVFVHNALVGFNLRQHIRVFASGKVTSGFELVKRLALGADACYSARGMMLALGCIQALRCNSNLCPTGVATQDPHLYEGLVPAHKSVRAANFHRHTVKSVCEIMGAMGVKSPDDLRPWHILRRTSPTEVHNYSEIYPVLAGGELIQEPVPPVYAHAWRAASAATFASVGADGR